MRFLKVMLPAVLLVSMLPASDGKSCCKADTVKEKVAAPACHDEKVATSSPEQTAPVQQKGSLPNVMLVDQDGRSLRLYDDLIKDATVAVNFIFTSCRTICPPMGAQFAAIEKLLAERKNSEIRLISISIDPINDTPQRLKEWRDQFHGGENWTLLTGKPDLVETALKAMEVYTAEKTDHSPFVLLGNDRTGQWLRTSGFASPEEILTSLNKLKEKPQQLPEGTEPDIKTMADPAPLGRAHAWFGDVVLRDQNNQEHRLYSDLMKGKTVLVNPFFSTCKGVCPPLMRTVKSLQDHLGDRLGKDVYILSISVDPLTDTPQKLAAYAASMEAAPGWFFLTGDKKNVDTALYKFGHYTDTPAAHSNLIVMGNEATGLWKKVIGLAPSDQVIRSLNSILTDKDS